MALKMLYILLFLFASLNSFAQIKAPKTPQFESHVSSPAHSSQTHLNAPGYSSSNQPRTSTLAAPPASGHALTQISGLLKELDNGNAGLKNSGQQIPAQLTRDFYSALYVLDSMLKGKKKLSLADAFYTIEHAYGNSFLSYDEYTAIIKQSAKFIKQWMTENGLDVKDNYMQHYAIQKFISQELTVYNTANLTENNAKAASLSHSPFYYDYDDYGGENNPQNLFVTKCLATGYGQCYSMPVIYMLLAEEMGVKSYLSMAPGHWFVKYPDNTGHIINYEATSNWKISDNWYADNLSILPEAIRSGIYLDTLNTEKIVANCAFDLGTAYMRSNGPDTNFIMDCLRVGTPHFPQSNNLPSLFLYQAYLRTLLADEMKKHNITKAEELNTAPSAKRYYIELMKNLEHLHSLGYQDLPPGRYKALTEEHEFKGRVQAKMDINTKQKRNLFSTPE